MPAPVCRFVVSLNCALAALASVAAGAGPYQDLSLENATEVAAKQGKRVAVVFVTSDKFSSCLDDALALPVLEGWRSNQVVLVRVEIEKERTAARLLGVTSVPTLVLAGPSPQSWVGCPDAGKMEEWAATVRNGASVSASVGPPPGNSLLQFNIRGIDLMAQMQKSVSMAQEVIQLCERSDYEKATPILVNALRDEQHEDVIQSEPNSPDGVLSLIEEVCAARPASRSDFVPVLDEIEKKLRSGEPTEEQVEKWIRACVATQHYDRVVSWYDRILAPYEDRETGFAWSDVADPVAIALAESGRWVSASKLKWLNQDKATNQLLEFERQISKYQRFESKEVPKRLLLRLDRLARKYALIQTAIHMQRESKDVLYMDVFSTKQVSDAARVELVRAILHAGRATASCVELLKEVSRPEAQKLIEQVREAVKKQGPQP